MIGTLQPGARFDLHMHTARSDGRYSAEEVLQRCADGGLDVVALTDHDLGSAVEPGVHELGGRRLHVVAGAEVSGVHDGREYHLLVYFPERVPDAFRAFCRAQCQERATRYRGALDNLAITDVAPPDAEAVAGERALTRYHLARELVRAGHARDVRHAFRSYLGDEMGRVPPLSLSFTEAIRTARALGGITSWAHPPVDAVGRYITAFTAAGLQGIEALRPQVTAKARAFYRGVARRNGLYLTGGSDWHGWREPDLGLFTVERRELGDFVDALLAA